MSLNLSLNEFKSEVVKADNFIKNAHKLNAAGKYINPKVERDFITSASFLAFFMAWEQFLEQATIKFMLGKKSISGKAFVRYVRPTSSEHAHMLLIGTNKYVDWSNPQIIRKLSNLVLDTSNPVNSVLSSIESDLFDLKTIRNSAAHLSSTTSTQLDALATRKLGVAKSKVNVAEFILEIDPHSIAPDVTIFDSYKTLLNAAASSIAT